MSSINIDVKKDLMNLALCTEHEPNEKNTPIVQLELECPGSMLEACEKNEHIWHCEKCKNQINRDAENYFHCACGKSKSENFTFKCSSEQHGPEFLSFPPEVMNKLLKEIPEVNVLVIGVSNEDTARWINSFVNFIAFPSLQKAIEGNLIETLPLTFDVMDKNNELQEVTFGASKMEGENICINVLGMGTTLMRVISVPGFGQCRDRENMIKYFRNLLSYLRNLKQLDGVGVLPNDTPIFWLCFEEFLNHFHPRVMRNVVFCFEHASIGEKARKFAAAKLFLSNHFLQYKYDATMDQSKARMYSIDADCFPYICAVKQGVKCVDDEAEISKLWVSSVNESKRLFSYFESVQPHNLNLTMWMIDAKMNVLMVSKPIADAIENVNRQIVEVLAKASENRRVQVLLPSFNIKSLPHFQTVCTNSKCIKFQSKSLAFCHENCYLDDIALAMPSEPRLKDCQAMKSGESLRCEICNCFWDEHMQISYIKTQKPDDYYLLSNGYCVYTNDDLEPSIQELEKEQQIIIEITAKIGCYLSKCSLMSFSSKFIQYLQNFIKAEEKVEKRSDEFINRLTFARNAYFVADKNLMQNGFDKMEYEKLLNELFTLKWNGKILKEMMAATSKALKSQACDGKVCEEFYKLHIAS